MPRQPFSRSTAVTILVTGWVCYFLAWGFNIIYYVIRGQDQGAEVQDVLLLLWDQTQLSKGVRFEGKECDFK